MTTTAFGSLDAPPIEILVLGELAVRGMGGQGLGDLEGRTHLRALLALASASRQGVSRDELASVLWPRLSESASRNRLYHTMHMARQALSKLAWPDDWLVLRNGRIALDPRIRSDAFDVERAFRDNTLENISRTELLDAIDMCRGEWAPDIDAGSLGLAIRRQLRESHVSLLKEAARRCHFDGDMPFRRELLERILAVQPTEGWAYQQLMQLDFDAGRYHSVLRRYEIAGRELGQHLGLRPSRALVELSAAATLHVEPGSMPVDEEGFMRAPIVGRERLVSELTAALAASPGAWNLHGLAGVGKTALMREVQRRVGSSLAHGSLWIELGHHRALSVEDIVCRAAGLDPDNDPDPRSAWTKLVTSRDLLLVLDDLDAHPDGARCLQSLPTDSRARVIGISRVALVIRGVQTVTVPPLTVPETGQPISHARTSPSVALFLMRRQVSDDHEWSPAYWEEVLALMQELDGLPLAIEVAAARSATMTAGELLTQLRAEGGNALGHDANPRLTEPVMSALALSMRLLRPETRCVLLGVSALSEWFDVADAVPVARAAGWHSADDLRERLDELTGAGLIERREESYRMLRLTRDQARRQAVQIDLWPLVRRARALDLALRLQAAAADVESSRFSAWLDLVAQIHDDILPLLDEARSSDVALFLELLLPLMQFWAVRGMQALALRWAPVGISAAQAQGALPTEIRLQTLLATVYNDGMRFGEALATTQRALSALERDVDPITRAQLVCARAEALASDGSLEDALALVDQELATCPASDAPGHATLLGTRLSLGQTSVSRHGADLASGASIAGWRARLTGSLSWCDLLFGLTSAPLDLPDTDRLALCQELLDAVRELHATRRVHAALAQQAWVLLSFNRLEDAERTIIAWYQLSRVSGRDATAAQACLWLAELAWRGADPQRARPWIDTARRLGAALHDNGAMEAQVTVHAMLVAALNNDLPGAIDLYLTLPRSFIANARGTALAHLTEAALLLAVKGGLEPVAQQMRQCLPALTAFRAKVPLVTEFRRTHLLLPERPTKPVGDRSHETSTLVGEATVERARTALFTLLDYWLSIGARRTASAAFPNR